MKRQRALGAHYEAGEHPSPDDFERTLHEVAQVLDRTDIPYLLMGGVVTAALARPRMTDDIDLFVTPDGAPRVVDELAAAGFRTEVADPAWLYKAFKHGVLVDVIFRSVGEIYLDDEMLRRSELREIDGVAMAVISPEDFLVIKALAADEDTPHHWYDALAIIARRRLDWDYVVSRARSAGPRRVLSLLLYAESNDLAVPIAPIRNLMAEIYPTIEEPP